MRTIKCGNIHMMGVPDQKERREKKDQRNDRKLTSILKNNLHNQEIQ
jgi:hypothetical protein